PRHILSSSREPALIREKLRELAKIAGNDTIRRERQRLVQDVHMISENAISGLVRARLKEERQLVAGSLDNIRDELVSRPSSTTKRVLILIADGFDLDPSSIIAGVTGANDLAAMDVLRRQLQTEMASLSVGPQV